MDTSGSSTFNSLKIPSFKQHVTKNRKSSHLQVVEFYDWESNLKIHLQCLRVMGLWPSGDKSFTAGIYTMYSFISVTLIACHILTITVNIYYVRHNLEAVVANIYILLPNILTKLKACFLLINVKMFKERFFELQNLYSLQPKNQNQKRLIENNLKTWRLIFKSFLCLCFGCNLFWMVPLLNVTSEEKMLPFLAWYPFNTKISPVYEITYIYQMFCTSYLTLICLNVEPLVCILNVYIACQFEMLSDNLKNFANATQNPREGFLKCITHHRQILSFMKSYSQFYKWIVFWHLIISGISIGLGMFQLSLVVPLSTEFYSLVSYECAIILQISMYCYFGNNVEVASNLVSYALFESTWPDLSKNMKKDLFIFTANLQQPVKISAFNLFVLSLDTLLKILKTAWSYFALLSNLKS